MSGSGSRLSEFEDDIRSLGVKGGNAAPERRLVIASGLVAIAGLVIVIIGFIGVRGSGSALAQGDNQALMLLGLTLAFTGVVVWARYSLTRYLRYWLARQIYEERAQTDRIVEAVEQQ